MKSTSLDPQITDQINQLLTLGLAAHENGQFEAAEDYYVKILDINPIHGDAHHLLGILFHEKKDFNNALSHLENAIQFAGPIAPFFNSLGNLLSDMQLLHKAREAYQKAIEISIASPLNEDKASLWEYYLNLGTALHSENQFSQAQQNFLLALQLAPNSPEVLNNLGNLYRDQSDFEAAIQHYEKAIALDPGYFAALYNLGSAYQKKQDHTHALKIWNQVIEINPQFAQAYDHIGALYFQQGKTQEAIAYYLKAKEVNPHYARAHFNLGTLYQSLNRMDEALQAYEESHRLDPKNIKCLLSMGGLHQIINQPHQAIQYYEKAYQISPEYSILIKKALTLPIIYQSNEEISQWRSHQWDTLKQIETFLSEPSISPETFSNTSENSKNPLTSDHLDPFLDLGCTNFYLAYQGFNDEAHQALLGKIIQLAYGPSLIPPPLSSSFKPKQEGQYKIGIFSRFLTKDHTITLLYQGLIHQLPRDKFEIVYFTLNKAEDVSVHFPLHPSDQLVELSLNSLSENHTLIQAQQLDLLYYLDLGMDPLSYYLAFSRLAPVQCTSWGHPSTSGIPTIDYFITQEDIDPVPQSDIHYTEKLVRFRHLNIFYSPPKALSSDDSTLAKRENFGFSMEDHLYICAQSLFKIHPDFDQILQGILDTDPKAQILFLHGFNSSWGEALKKRWAKSVPVHHQRIHILTRLDHQGFIAFQTVADVLLDSFPFAGGNTTLEALGYGIPVVTLNNPQARGRVSLAIYKQMNVLDCIAENFEEYIAIAVKLATESEYRLQISQKIVAAHSKIFETKAPVQELTTFFCQAIQEAQNTLDSTESVEN
ncbi:MAG: tetratricopeptide repeat protein [Cyanobacteria bacterium]|nr:tetratricopeptide repeat protein [Cyanobacteriota bacterium]